MSCAEVLAPFSARAVASVVLAALLAGCATTADAVPTPVATATPTAADTPFAPALTDAASPSPSKLAAPPDLFGTWRTTLVGQPVTLTIGEDFYRVHRGVAQATGEIRVDGDRIDFFGSDLCGGLGEYRWSIEGDTLRFASLTEECPGRAEALLNVRYGDYSPPADSDG